MTNFKNINCIKLRLFFIVFLCFEIFVFSFINNTSDYADLGWHIDAGQKILSGNWNIDTFIYSPVFSIITSLINDNNNNFSSRLIFELIKLILIFNTSFCLLLLIDFKKLSDFNQITIKEIFPLVFLILNPYIIKYSSPPYSDTYSLIAGVIFALRYSYNDLSQNIRNQTKSLYRYITGKRYYLLVIFLSLIRYPVVIILFSSLLSDFHNNILKKYNNLLNRFFKYLFFISITIIIFYLSNNHIEKFNLSTNSIILVITFFISTLGFREALSTDLSTPLNLLNPERISELFISKDIFISQLELQFTIFIGVLLFVISLFSIIKLFYFRIGLTSSFIIALLILLSSELYIGFAHYRYFLIFLPSIIISLTLGKREILN